MKIQLRNLRESDAEGMLEWMHDPETKQWFRYPMDKQTKDDVISFINSANGEVGKVNSLHFAVADEDDKYLGTISLKNIDYTSKNAEYAISMRKCSRGTGAAYQATIQIINYAFNMLNLEKVYLNVLKENKRAIAFYEKVGFKFEGESRKAVFFNENYHDLFWYSTLKEEWDMNRTEQNFENRGGKR